MTEGTSQGLFIVVAIVIFGIFVSLSYTLFGNTLQPALTNIFVNALNQAEGSLNYTEENPQDISIEETDSFIKGYIELTGVNDGRAYTYYADKVAKTTVIVSSGTITGDRREVILDEGVNLTGNIYFPDKIAGYPVIGIGVKPTTLEASSGFVLAKFTGTIKLPSELTIIPDGLFNRSEFTGSLKIPNKVTYIGNQSFINSKFKGSLTIPDSVKEIGTQAFTKSEFDGNLKLGTGLEHIGDRAFINSNFKGTLVLPNKLKTIGVGALHSSQFRGELVLNEELEYIGSDAFTWTGFDGKLTLNANLKGISDNAFSNSNFSEVIDNSNSETLIAKDSIRLKDGTFFTK